MSGKPPRAWGSRRGLAAAAFASLGLSSSVAHALTQSDGTVIPVGNNLVNFLNGAGETIVPLTDAATTPETFTPACQLTFTVIGRGASQKNSFGWYNVTGVKPALGELVEFIGCNDAVGAVKVLDIRSDPRYAGGLVGFFQATTEGHTGGFLGIGGPNCVNLADPANTLGHVYYSEKIYNEDNNPSGPSYVHLLIMDSKVRKSTFYFGWEDLFQGGDNDFEDLLTRVEGIQCSGGGAACPTGLQGVCGLGVMQCRNGVLACAQHQQAQAEKCNAVDDDCNGLVDDGDLCPPSEICDRGTCVHKCGGGEFKCRGGYVCSTDGYCVDPACQNVTCGADQVCVGGSCRGACDGIVCPYGQTCNTGACVDPCAGIECDPGQICDQGICVACQCGECPSGTVCNQASTACVPPGCEAVTCAAGAHCTSSGGCVDGCEGATCPGGQLCQNGFCTSDPNAADAGASAGAGGSGLIFGSGTGGDVGIGGASTTGTGATPGTAQGGAGNAAPPPVGAPLGCGCRVLGREAGGGSRAWRWALVLGAAIRRARRRPGAKVGSLRSSQ